MTANPLTPVRPEQHHANRAEQGFRQLFEEGFIATGRHGSASERDLALCQMLHRLFGPDSELLDLYFRRSKLFRPKWLDDNYRNRTIALALRTGWWQEPPSHQHTGGAEDDAVVRNPRQEV